MKALSSSLVGALALLVLALGVPHSVGAAESPEAVAAAEVSADAVTLVAGPELFCHNCYNSHFSCTEEVLVIHASACVGGVVAVLGVDQSFGSFL
jgi:hypothetical protein